MMRERCHSPSPTLHDIGAAARALIERADGPIDSLSLAGAWAPPPFSLAKFAGFAAAVERGDLTGCLRGTCDAYVAAARQRPDLDGAARRARVLLALFELAPEPARITGPWGRA